MKTILYARSACPNPEAIRKQLVELEQCAAAYGLTDWEHVVDDGVPSTCNPYDRPGFGEMMDQLYSDDIATIIVVNLDRISRNMRTTSEIMRELENSDVRLISITEHIDTMKHKYEEPEPMVPMLYSIFREMQGRRYSDMDIHKWGRMHECYLEKSKPAFLNAMRECGRLKDYLQTISDAADFRLRSLLKSMREEAGLPEHPAADNIAEWTRRMDELYNKAAKIIRKELIEN